MALIKPVRQENGLTLSYHMIARLDIEPNQQCTVLVHSYLDADARKYEKDYAAGLMEGEPNFPYYSYRYIQLPYIPEITLTGAYEWLKKNLPEFEGAESDIENKNNI